MLMKFSQFDLLNTCNLTNTGNIFNKFFESKYISLFIKIPENDLKRGLMLVSDVNDLLKAEKEKNIIFTIEKLMNILYLDFIKQVTTGIDNGKYIDLKKVADTLKNEIKQYNLTREFKQIEPNHYAYQDISNAKNIDKSCFVKIKILKKWVLRGEVFLQDIIDKFQPLDITTVEELISLRYRCVINEVKEGNYQILYSIVKNILNNSEI
ncbi:MAG: hypothetical protein AB7V16_11340 [Vulcanibacillus sp.]